MNRSQLGRTVTGHTEAKANQHALHALERLMRLGNAPAETIRSVTSDVAKVLRGEKPDDANITYSRSAVTLKGHEAVETIVHDGTWGINITVIAPKAGK